MEEEKVVRNIQMYSVNYICPTHLHTKRGAVKSFVLFVAFSLCVFFALWASTVNAASFQFTPISGSFSTSDRFTAEISIDTEGAAINAAEGVISFNSRYLTVESVAIDTSIFRFWVEEPKFSNAAGTISFSGGLPTPGYTGPNGKVLRVAFRTTGVGIASLKFTSGAILANDGLGTNILTTSQEARYEIKSVKIVPPVSPTPPKPTLVSGTHPDEVAWYNGDEFRASWDVPAGVDSVNYALVEDSDFALPRKSKDLVSEASYDLREFEDGIWYFFVRFHAEGGWGPIARHIVKVDRTPPLSFTVTRINIDDVTSPQPILDFETIDETSGVAVYQVRIESGEWSSVESGPYTLPAQEPGERTVTVRALDNAGNYSESAIVISVEPIEAPSILSYSKEIRLPDQPLVVEGTSLPNVRILGYLRKADTVFAFEGVAGSDGVWKVVYSDEIPRGIYALTVQARDDRGALSLETESVNVRVTGLFSDIIDIVKRLLERTGVVIIAILILLLLIVFSVFTHRRVTALQNLFIKALDRFKKKFDRDLDKLRRDLGGTSDQVADWKTVIAWVFTVLRLLIVYSLLMIFAIVILGTIAVVSFFAHSRATKILKGLKKGIESRLEHLEKEDDDETGEGLQKDSEEHSGESEKEI